MLAKLIFSLWGILLGCKATLKSDMSFRYVYDDMYLWN